MLYCAWILLFLIGKGMSDKPKRHKRASIPLWRKMMPIAREKRIEQTAAEEFLWQYIRNRQLAGIKFRRQQVIDHYIVDFYCHAAALVIEVDGSIHEQQKEEDALRQAEIEASGTVFIRFSNDEVMGNIAAVLEKIVHEVNKRRSTKAE
jgi:very-short-patch-repair endonuclease